MDDSGTAQLSVIIPTFNNLNVLKRCMESWRRFGRAGQIEILVIEDGCRDSTRDYLASLAETEWGRRQMRWFHEDDVNELKCNNRGFAESRAPLLLVWQDDMFLQCDWFVDELIATFAAYPEIGLLSLSRGLNCYPLDEPIVEWEDLLDWRRLESTIGKAPLNWMRLQEVDIVVRPWIIRRECLDKVGYLDEAFCPHEWDEADLCFRIRQAGWRVATHGYERLGAYEHLGSSTLSRKEPSSQQRVALANGRLFHERWGGEITREHARRRAVWRRRAPARSWIYTLQRMARSIRKNQVSK